MLRRLYLAWNTLRRSDRHWTLKVLAGLSLLYVISPIDILPLLGWIDDAIFLLGGASYVIGLLERPVQKQRKNDRSGE